MSLYFGHFDIQYLVATDSTYGVAFYFMIPLSHAAGKQSMFSAVCLSSYLGLEYLSLLADTDKQTAKSKD